MAYDIYAASPEMKYRFLARMQADCLYYLLNGRGFPRHLWAYKEGMTNEQAVKAHISAMKKLYDCVPENPEWLSWDEIGMYGRFMMACARGERKLYMVKPSGKRAAFMKASSDEEAQWMARQYMPKTYHRYMTIRIADDREVQWNSDTLNFDAPRRDYSAVRENCRRKD